MSDISLCMDIISKCCVAAYIFFASRRIYTMIDDIKWLNTRLDAGRGFFQDQERRIEAAEKKIKTLEEMMTIQTNINKDIIKHLPTADNEKDNA